MACLPCPGALCTQVAVDPRFLEAYQQLGAGVELATADASELAGEQEELTYAQLQQRALRLRQVRCCPSRAAPCFEGGPACMAVWEGTGGGGCIPWRSQLHDAQ